MDYKANYQAWLQDPRLSEEGRKELESIKDNEKELEYRFGGEM
jgi:phosphoglucomutase